MNLGKIKAENEKFLESYKDLGFRTKTELANVAFDDLRRKMAQKKRQQWRELAAAECKDLVIENVFESIESDDFR